MTGTFKPMLASPVDLEKLKFPVIVSPKLDGIRCVITDDGPKTRMLKDIPNDYIRGYLSKAKFKYLDGEILTYTDGKVDDFNTIQGNVMRRDGKPEFKFLAFDYFRVPTAPYAHRLKQVDLFEYGSKVWFLECVSVKNMDGLLRWEQSYVNAGYEGMMIRSPDAPYKFGRSTTKEQGLLKMKRFHDSEASVIGITERMHNANVATVGELGQTKRSSHKENMVPTGALGTLTVKWNDVEFDIGTGFNEAQRLQYFRQQSELIGKTVTFKYQELSKYGVPRFPVFLGFRYDLEENNAQS